MTTEANRIVGMGRGRGHGEMEDGGTGCCSAVICYNNCERGSRGQRRCHGALASGRRRPRSVAHLMDTVWSIIKLKPAAKIVTRRGVAAAGGGSGSDSWATAGAGTERRTRASSLTIDSTTSRPAARTARAARLATDRSQAKRARGLQRGLPKSQTRPTKPRTLVRTNNTRQDSTKNNLKFLLYEKYFAKLSLSLSLLLSQI